MASRRRARAKSRLSRPVSASIAGLSAPSMHLTINSEKTECKSKEAHSSVESSSPSSVVEFGCNVVRIVHLPVPETWRGHRRQVRGPANARRGRHGRRHQSKAPLEESAGRVEVFVA